MAKGEEDSGPAPENNEQEKPTSSDSWSSAAAEETGFDTQDPHRRPPAGDEPKKKSVLSHTGEVILGRYRLEAFIARGGMGAVYRATQLGLGRQVAVKLLAPRSSDRSKRFARRFFLEASICSKLVHPNIITIHDYGESQWGDMFIVMEHVDGASLFEILTDEGPMSLDRVLRIAIQIARALREAHKNGVIHRDLKLQNIMVTRTSEQENPDLVKVLDFGLVKLVGAADIDSEDQPIVIEGPDTELTATGPGLLGSPRYMSPDQITGDPVDARSDIYSLGVVLYELVAGSLPFLGKSKTTLIYQHLSAPVPPINSMGYERSCPEQLEALIKKCLEKTPADRYPSMDLLIDDLKAAYQVVLDGEVPKTSSFSLHHDSKTEVPTDPRVATKSMRAPEGVDTVTDTEEISFDTSAERASLLSPDLAPKAQEHSKERKWIPLFIVLSLLLLAAAVGALAQRMALEQPTEKTPEPLAPTTETQEEIRVSFVSNPPGAQVVADDEVIGVTPFVRAFAETDEPKQFLFRLKGHEPQTIEQRLQGGSANLLVTLRPVAAAKAKGVAKPIRKTRPTATETAEIVAKPDASQPAVEPAERIVDAAVPVPKVEKETPKAKVEKMKPPAPEKNKPKNVPAHVLQQELVKKVSFELPPHVTAAHRGERLRIVVLICTDTKGGVDPQRTKIISGVPGSNNAVLAAVRQWRYKPQQVPLCAPMHFSINVKR